MVDARPADRKPPAHTDTVIIGNGPSALALSYLLHGNIPSYDQTHPHPDRILHKKLVSRRDHNLYDSLRHFDQLVEHFAANETYSTDAWNVNVLVDALLNPAEGYDVKDYTCVKFARCDKFAQDHVVLGRSGEAGGQWAGVGSETVEQRQARTLSYREHLSLFGYTYEDFYRDRYDGATMPRNARPRRSEVAEYYRQYAVKAEIDDALYNDIEVERVERLEDELYRVHGRYPGGTFVTDCRRIVLATGLYSEPVQPPAALARFTVPTPSPSRRSTTQADAPILVVGSGFSAADAVAENLQRGRKVVHVYKWHKAGYVSPLKYCHKSAYPDYADVYRRMKLAAAGSHRQKRSEETGRGDETGAPDYVGLADVEIASVDEGTDRGGNYTVRIKVDDQKQQHAMIVSGIAVMLGRRTNLSFLEPRIRKLLHLDSRSGAPGSSDTGRRESGWLEKSGLKNFLKHEGPALIVDGTDLLCIGSLTGDTLVRFGHGAVLGAAVALLKI